MRAIPLLALVLLATACGAAPEPPRAATDGKRVSGHGLEITIPDGWHGDVTKLGPHHAATLRAATFPLPPEPDIGHEAQRTMGRDDLLVVVADYGAVPGGDPAPASLRVDAEHVGSFEGFRHPTATTSADVAGTRLQVWVVAAREPTRAQLEQATAILATLRLERSRRRAYVDETRGLSAQIPAGWAVAEESLTPALEDTVEILSTGTGAFKPGSDRCAHIPERTLEALGGEDAFVTLVELETGRGLPLRPADLGAADGEEPESRGCLANGERLDYRVIPFTDAGRDFYLYVAFGPRATAERRREADDLLASLRFDRADDVAFADAEVGVSGRHPPGWHRERALTGFVEPREVLALASYPLRRGAKAGECAPDTARADIPADGAFVWLLEYRSGVPIDRFPERPRPFRLDRERLDDQVSCFPGPGSSWSFQAAGRRFQLLVAFGGRPSESLLREVEAILNALELEEVPMPPPPPWADWPLLPTSAPDSMRAPPGWPAAGAEFDSAADAPPRALFFASNRPLPLLPRRLVERARLPGHFPGLVLAHGFPDDAVLLWVLEESSRRPLAKLFPPIDRTWPEPADFRPVEIATKPAPHVRWLVSSGEWMDHRFSVWIARGPAASREDLDLALTAAGTLAVSGCDRGVGAACAGTDEE